MSAQKRPEVETITVSEKHIKARIAAFILAFVVALIAFTNGFLNLGNTKEGYYDLIADKDADAPYYAAGITYTCLFEGSRGEVRSAVREADAAYSQALSWAYKLCDAENEYPGYVNLASLNRELRECAEEKLRKVISSTADIEGAIERQTAADGGGAGTDQSGAASLSGELSPDGERMSFSLAPELYSALKYAYSLTGLECGYSLFAGPVYDEWRNIIYSEDPSAFDPALNADEAERLGKLAAAVADRDGFDISAGMDSSLFPTAMVFDDQSCTVDIEVPVAVYMALGALESDAPLIDFGPLHDAFMLEMTLSRLDMSGAFGKGLIKSGDGLAADLRDGSIYCGLDRAEGRTLHITDSSEMGDPEIMKGCLDHASSYSVEITSDEGVKTVKRDLFFDVYSGLPVDQMTLYGACYVKSSGVINLENHDLAYAVFRMLCAASSPDQETHEYRKIRISGLQNVFTRIRESCEWED